MNIYKPELMKIIDIIDETPDIKTFKLQFKDENVKNSFSFKAGQFAEYSVFGEGECTFCIASSPTEWITWNVHLKLPEKLQTL